MYQFCFFISLDLYLFIYLFISAKHPPPQKYKVTVLQSARRRGRSCRAQENADAVKRICVVCLIRSRE